VTRRSPAAAAWAVALLALLGGCGEKPVVEPSDPAVERPPPAGPDIPIPNPLIVVVTGDDYNWHLRYPGEDGQIDTADDIPALRHLHLPTGIAARLKLQSMDFLYTLALPHLGLKEIAVPDLEFWLEFETTTEGVFELRGDQFCGYAHPDLLGTLVVEPPADFQAWLQARRAAK